MSKADRSFALAERVARLLEARGVQSALIGAAALSAHGYARATEDIDLATSTDPFTTLRDLVAELLEGGIRAELRTPDASDSLGGVVDIRLAGAFLVQVVNFYNPLARSTGRLGQDAIASSQALSGSALRVVDVPHLIALKLYAGGRRDEHDILELLHANLGVSTIAVREVCARFALGEALDRLLSKA